VEGAQVDAVAHRVTDRVGLAEQPGRGEAQPGDDQRGQRGHQQQLAGEFQAPAGRGGLHDGVIIG